MNTNFSCPKCAGAGFYINGTVSPQRVGCDCKNQITVGNSLDTRRKIVDKIGEVEDAMKHPINSVGNEDYHKGELEGLHIALNIFDTTL